MTEAQLLEKGWIRTGDGWLLKGASIRLTAAGKKRNGLAFEDAVKIQNTLDTWWEESRR